MDGAGRWSGTGGAGFGGAGHQGCLIQQKQSWQLSAFWLMSGTSRYVGEVQKE
jgi:hypothetical protein